MMMALMESSSANFLSWPTTIVGSRMTPSKSTTPILSPKPPKPEEEDCDPACSVRYTRVNTASTKRKNAPPPIKIQTQVRERFSSAILGLSVAPGAQKRRFATPPRPLRDFLGVLYVLRFDSL